MKILLIGGTSNLSKHLITRLGGANEIITLGRNNSDVVYDFSVSSPFPALPSSIDVVINTVAHFVDQTPAELAENFNVNLMGSLKTLKACLENGVAHYISISSIFALYESNDQNYSGYSLSKRCSDEVALFFSQKFNLPLTVLRPTQLIGNPEAINYHQTFYRSIVTKAWRGEDINIYGTQDPKRNFLHYEDLAELISRLIALRILGCFLCQYPQNTTISGLAKQAIEAFKSRSKIVFLPDKPNIADNVFDYDDSLYRLLDWYPKISLEQTLQREYQILQTVQP